MGLERLLYTVYCRSRAFCRMVAIDPLPTLVHDILVCPRCGGEMEIIAFITEAPTVRAILTHIGEPNEAPPISPCRGPPEWEMFNQMVDFDPIHPEPEYEFDQSVSW